MEAVSNSMNDLTVCFKIKKKQFKLLIGCYAAELQPWSALVIYFSREVCAHPHLALLDQRPFCHKTYNILCCLFFCGVLPVLHLQIQRLKQSYCHRVINEHLVNFPFMEHIFSLPNTELTKSVRLSPRLKIWMCNGPNIMFKYCVKIMNIK